jgi:sugar lactone lactonase YvrE
VGAARRDERSRAVKPPGFAGLGRGVRLALIGARSALGKIAMTKLTLALLVVVPACTSMSSSDDAGDDAPPFTNGVSTLSGAADAGYVDGARGTARFANPVNVAYGPGGKLYVADFDNNKIRVVDADDGNTGTLISQPGFQKPFAMAFASDGTLYVTTDNDQAGNHSAMTGSIWRVDVGAGEATIVANAIGRPRGIVVLRDGRLAVSDYMHHVIQIVNPSTGQVAPLAGTWDVKGAADGLGGVAKFSTPYGMAMDASGQLVVADYDNHRLRIVGLDGSVATYAGMGSPGFADGAMATAQFNHPQGVAADSSGNLYVTDLGNYRVRMISGDAVQTIAGNGNGGYVDDDDRLASELYGLEGLSVSGDGAMVFAADGGRGEAVPYNRVRSIKMK